MKKIVSAVAAASLLAGAAFAEFTVTGNARVYANAFNYGGTSRYAQSGPVTSDTNGKGVDDTGTVKMMEDKKHADDVTIQAKGDKSGVKIVFNVTSSVQTYNTTETKTDVNLTSYQLWTTIGDWRVDAGAYDQRLAKNLNNDGNWNENYSRSNKPGIWLSFGQTSKAWGKDAANITTILGNKTRTNFQVSNSKLVDGLTLRGVLFLSTDGTATNGTSTTHDEKWIFTPFAVGGTYQLDGDTKLNFNAKLSSITHGSVSTTAASTAYTTYTPDNSVWTLNANLYKKLSDALEIEAGYTLGMALYSDWSGLGAHVGKANDTTVGNTKHYGNGRLVRDNDVFAHGLDFAMKDKLSDQLSLTAIAGINYIQGTAAQRAKSDAAETAGTWRDSRAKAYEHGAAGTLAYYATLSVDYKQSDLVTLELQTKVTDANLFSVETVGTSKRVDYLSGLTWNIRPGILVNPDKTSQLFAGVDFGLKGFKTNATGKNNQFSTSVTIPVGLRVKL